MNELMRSRVRGVGNAAAAFAVLMLVGQVVEAGPHRARLSSDLERRLTAGGAATISVIVPGSDALVQTLASRYGARIKKGVKGGAVLEVTDGQLAALSEDPAVTHLSGDARVQRTMDVTSESTGATQVWSGVGALRGFTGRGIGVAVIDSGVAQHTALRGRIVAALDLTDAAGGSGDRFGHGTHVAGIIAGRDDQGYAGIAPGAHIVSLRVLGKDGSGDTSDVINALDWVVEHKAQYGLRVVNLSLGHPVFESYRDDPLCLAVQRAVDAGLVVVAAAGNLGKTDDGRAVVGGIISPGNTPAALTVGAVNTRDTALRSDDVMATYSSRGPSAIDGVLKPDLVAPGNKIAAAAAPGSYLAETYPERIVAGQGANAYIALSGTSMASAVVSGAVALLLEANPSLTPADAKFVLQVTSSRVAGAGLIEAGAGSLNVAAGVSFGTGNLLQDTKIGGETVLLTRQTSVNELNQAIVSLQAHLPRPIAQATDFVAIPQTIVWGETTIRADTIVWGD